MASRYGAGVNRDRLRMVLIGITGSGKSSTGNTLIGKKVFESKGNSQSVTKVCRAEETERCGKRILVVDTPGILDTAMSEEKLKIQLMECTFLACPGVHAFLYVMKIGQRDIAEKQKEVFLMIKKFLGERFLSHTVIVFTGKESLEEDDQTLQQYISEMETEYTNFIGSCEGGVVAISNTSGENEKEKAAEQIIDAVGQLICRSNICYQNVLFDEKNKQINRIMEQILQENEKIQNEINEISESSAKTIGDDTATRSQRDNLRKRIEELQNKIVQRSDLRNVANKRLQTDAWKERAKRTATIVGVGAAGAIAVAGGAAGCAAVAGVSAIGEVAGVAGGLSAASITAVTTYVTGRLKEK